MKDEIKLQREGEISKKAENKALKVEYNRLRDQYEQCLRLKQKYSSQVNGLFRKNADPYAEPRPIDVVFTKTADRRAYRKDDDDSTLRATRATDINERHVRPQSAAGKTRLLDWNVLEDCLKREVVVPPSRPRSAASLLGRTGSGQMRFPAPAAQHQPMSESRSFAVIPGAAIKNKKQRPSSAHARSSSRVENRRPKSAGAMRSAAAGNPTGRPGSRNPAQTPGNRQRQRQRPHSAGVVRSRG